MNRICSGVIELLVLAALASAQTVYNFSPDGMGRPYSANSGVTVLVNSVTYNPANQVTDINLGAGDKDDYQYDSNTGRMTQYKFSVGATPTTLTGNLNWNTNGTLNTQNITDGFNSGDTQNCTYGYDDLARIGSVGCGSVWSQTFTYNDRYGNIKKSGSISWQPNYDTTTNRYVGGGTSYDAKGNLLNDSLTTYTWNVYGKPATVGGNPLVYDAFDRLAQDQAVGVGKNIIYSPIGRIAVFSAAPNYEIPLPGGASFETNRYAFIHRDGLGSGRLYTSVNGRNMQSDTAYAPFGEAYSSVGNQGNEFGFEFTGLPEDIENISAGFGGLQDAVARELRVRQGRWISPDPAGLGAMDATNPQTFNRYAYVANNPMSANDPSGLDGCDITSDSSATCSVSTDWGSGGTGGSGGISWDGTWWNSPGLIVLGPSLGDVVPYNIFSNIGTPGLNIHPPTGLPPAVGGPPIPNIGRVPLINATTTPDLPLAPGSPLGNGDVAAGAMAQQVFQGNRQLWNSANTWGNAAFYGTGAVLAAPATIEGAATVAAHGIGWAYGLTGGSGVVLGQWNQIPNYIDAAKQMGANYLNIWTPLYNGLNKMGVAWTANQAFLDASILRGQQFYLSTAPSVASGTYAMELQYLISRGIGASQWLMASPYLSIH
jgi:RHS repeat-associated protein